MPDLKSARISRVRRVRTRRRHTMGLPPRGTRAHRDRGRDTRRGPGVRSPGTRGGGEGSQQQCFRLHPAIARSQGTCAGVAAPVLRARASRVTRQRAIGWEGARSNRSPRSLERRTSERVSSTTRGYLAPNLLRNQCFHSTPGSGRPRGSKRRLSTHGPGMSPPPPAKRDGNRDWRQARCDAKATNARTRSA